MENMATFKKSFEDGLYQAGRAWEQDGVKCAPAQHVGLAAYKAGVWPDDKELDRLTNRLIKKHRMFEFEDTRIERAREHCAHKWIMDQYFKDYGLQTTGALAATVEKAFQVVPAELTVFPFFWDNIIVEGILAVPLLDIMLADTVSINSGTAVHAVMNETVTDRTIGNVGEFVSMQEVNISSTESAVKLKEFGAKVTVSDHAMRRQRLPVFERGMARYGRQIGIDVTSLVLDILINGDTVYGGLNGAAPTVAAPSVSGSPTYNDYVRLALDPNIGYEYTDIILGRNGIIKLLEIPQFQEPLSGFRFQNEGILPQPFGLQSHRWDDTRSTTWASGNAAGGSTLAVTLQRGRAAILYQEGGLATESFRIEGRKTTVQTSWNVIAAIADRDAVRVMSGVA
jgi:hypothetical protein